MGKRKPRKFASEFKAETVRPVQAGSKRIGEVARDLEYVLWATIADSAVDGHVARLTPTTDERHMHEPNGSSDVNQDSGASTPLQSGVLTSPADGMLSRAIAQTLLVPPHRRAFLFEQLAQEIVDYMAAHPEQRPWSCTIYTGTDGSRIFRGGIGHSLVIDPSGRIWRARSYEDFETTYDSSDPSFPIASLTPVYAQMRSVA